MKKRRYDIVVFGATGFTGGLVAEYLNLSKDIENKNWAIAGRSLGKLKVVKDKLISKNGDASQIDILVADATDINDLKKITAQTQCIITTVGPFVNYGEPLVAACIDTSTDYLDITGEPAFVQNILQKYGKAAKESGSLIINCCGFDSIPADAGAFFTAQQLPVDESKVIKGYVRSNGTFSGGTWASAIGAFADISKGKASTKSESNDKSAKKLPTLHRVSETNKWALPMPVIDPWMVKRTAKARPEIFGETSYAQYLALNNVIEIAGLTATVGGIMLAAQIPFTKNLLLNYRKSGEGPSEEKRSKSFFSVVFVGESRSKKVVCKVSGGDPGYTETSKMIAESALTLIKNRSSLAIQSGVTTPAAALGEFLIPKLQSVGIKFEVIKKD